MDMEVELERELERELAAEQEELLEEVQERMMQAAAHAHRPLAKVYSLPANFTFTSLCANEKGALPGPMPPQKQYYMV